MNNFIEIESSPFVPDIMQKTSELISCILHYFASILLKIESHQTVDA